jgi:hypothetical protein
MNYTYERVTLTIFFLIAAAGLVGQLSGYLRP